MVADIARVTYDPGRQYRAVVRQQGRVTLEADGNEASAIAVELLRLETIDIFGPTAAFGDGYKVAAAGGAITISPGIFYLGGWRLKLDAPVELAQQPDWIDAPTTAFRGGNQVITLLLTEQSVSAVEDQALREVALGGPDSAARDRLMQHFLRIAVNGNSCAVGASRSRASSPRTGSASIRRPADRLRSQAPGRLRAGTAGHRSLHARGGRRLSRRRQPDGARHRHRL